MSNVAESSSRELAIEASAESCVSYDFLLKYLDNLSFTTPSSRFVSTSLHEILNKIYNDKCLNNIFDARGSENIKSLFSLYEDYVLEYWKSWIIEDPIKRFQDSQDIAISLLIQTVKPGRHAYDFFVAHVLTTSHAIRILLPPIPKQYQIDLIRQRWLIAIAIYISQLRPEISHDKIEISSGKDWKYVQHRGISGSWATDADYVKIIRAMREAASTWGDNRQQYLAATARLTDDFDGWTRFS
ncbi:putative mgs207 protein [Golovinomyces cichoracearum]|uniref:Putative mgs207 protein n=1 Tax=Golovinomyces cichoracearum TaxID=62708 RepID=A0A420IS83_9PEZI|nr:putative mgs207 protein [Golovinomyces cichoracearum]